jgi:hypothetical protein
VNGRHFGGVRPVFFLRYHPARQIDRLAVRPVAAVRLQSTLRFSRHPYADSTRLKLIDPADVEAGDRREPLFSFALYATR